MVLKNCLICGKEFYTKPSKIKKGFGKYCSLSCAGKTNKGKSRTLLSNIKEKKCSKCKLIKKITEYVARGAYANGSTRYQSWCKECHKEYDKNSYHNGNRKKQVQFHNKKRKETINKILKTIKSTHRCCICKEADSTCLDFHHLNNERKNFNLGHNDSKSWSKIKLEIQKCIVICSNCHRKFHANEIKLPKNLNPCTIPEKFNKEKFSEIKLEFS